VATETYTRGLVNFLQDELGLPCTFQFSRTAGTKPDNAAVRDALRATPPLVLYGSYNERLYAAELGSRCMYIPASFPGAIIRRSTGTPFMGYAGATYLVQEYCNALFDALFHILPLATDMDRAEATPAKAESWNADPWDPEAVQLLDDYVESEPFLVRISAAKRLRDQVERDVRLAREGRVTADRVARSLAALAAGRAA
jgi:chlorophyllide a reductase subunit Z